MEDDVKLNWYLYDTKVMQKPARWAEVNPEAELLDPADPRVQAILTARAEALAAVEELKAKRKERE